MLAPPPSRLRVALDAPLAPLTTLELGGPARALVRVNDEQDAIEAVAWAQRERLPLLVLGGGSNLVIADRGFDGVVLKLENRGMTVQQRGGRVLVEVAAGESWDRFVEQAVAEGWGGVECLSGIPGSVGATPVQNVGAYGQEVAESTLSIRALDRATGRVVRLPRARCRFGYRTSALRERPDRYLVLAVRFALTPGARPAVRYPELAGLLGDGASLADVRAAVLELRANKSMVISAEDRNRRSVGSFFVNPVVSASCAHAALERLGVARENAPVFPTDGGVKLSAAWLIERCGFAKGERHGAVGISSRHSLALVHHGGGSAQELIALARTIRDRVREMAGVELRPEPCFAGFGADPLQTP